MSDDETQEQEQEQEKAPEPTGELAATGVVQEPISEGEPTVPEAVALQPIPVHTEIVKQPNDHWTFKVPGLPARIAEGRHVADAAASLGYTFAEP